MRSPLSIFSFRRQNPLAGLMLFLLGVLLIEGVLAFLTENPLVRGYRSQQLPKESPDWQIMGDSVAAGGILVDQLAIQFATNASVVNLALSASGPEFPYFTLKRQVAMGAAPKAIIYAPSPHTFGSKRVGLLVGAYATWPEIVEIAMSGKEPFEVLYGVICKFSYALRNREQLAEVLKGRRLPQGFDPAKLVESTTKSEGGNKAAFPVEKIPNFYRKGFEMNDFNRFFSQKFLAEAQARRIPIYWVVMPVLEVVKETRKPFDFDVEYQQFLAANHQQYGVVLLPESPVFPPELFLDYTHLNEEGAALFTGMLSDEMKRTLRE